MEDTTQTPVPKPCIYSFHRCINGNLRFKGKYSPEFYTSEQNNNIVVFKDTEIETAKDNFLIQGNRVVKVGKTWLNSELTKKLLKQRYYNFVDKI